jgi:hypothetical protein
MAEYFTESQYNILADWSDEKLLELEGTNEAIDAEIKRRKTPEVITDTKEGGGIFKKGWESLKDLFSEADVPDEGLIQLAKGVTFRNPLQERWKEGIKKHDEWGWDMDVEPITGDYTRDEFDLQLRLRTLDTEGQQLYDQYLNKYPNADKEKVMNILQRKYTDEKSKKAVKRKYGVVFHRPEVTQTSSAQYLIDQARKGEFDTDTLGVEVASAGDLRGSGIPEIIERKRQAAKEAAIAGGVAGASAPTPKIETTAPGQAGGYQHPGGQGQNRERQREERAEQVQREVARYKDTATTGAKAGFSYGLQEGGFVDQKRRAMSPFGQANQLGILGLQGYQGGQNPQILTQNPHIQNGGRQPPRGIQDILGGGGPKGLWPKGLWPRPQQAPWEEFGEQLGGYEETLGGYGEQLGGYEEQLGGFGETLGGYGEQIGGFGEQMSGVEEAMGGFSGQFDNLNNKLDSMEKGIASLSDQLQPKQPQFGGYGGYGGYGGGYGGYGGGFGYRGRYG